MKVVQINTFPYKATGNIMLQIHDVLQELGYESYIVWGRGRQAENEYEFSIEDPIGMSVHGAITRIFDRTGFASWRATRKLIAYLEDLKPDIVHLHNLHGYYLNIKMLFNYLNNKKDIKVVWTIHDCWPITGHCAYFSEIHCDKWQNGCKKCPQKHTYPKTSVFDLSKSNWKMKKKLFTGRKIQLVTPSYWLKSILQQSFLNQNDIKVIYNGLDTEVFKATKTKIFGKKYVLGVASEWTERKGLQDFLALRQVLSDDYDIVLIGLKKEQIKNLPKGIIGLKKTKNATELAEYYSSAEVFVNLSVEETMGMTTVEALACGTPVIVYNSTALPEVVDEYSGVIIDEIHNVQAVADAIENITKKSNLQCRLTAAKYEKKKQFGKYVDLYKNVWGFK